MFPGFDLSKLPSLPWSQRNSLPACPAVYFAVDSNNRVLYVGKAINLLNRWKNHHRLEKLHRINRKYSIKIAWLTCSNNPKTLTNIENYFIELYQPLLNQTSVPAKKIIPAEIALQQTLRKLANLNVVVLGFELAIDSFLPTVYIKYSIILKGVRSLGNTSPINNIIKANNERKSTRLRWREYEREKFDRFKVRSWKTICNGVNIDLSPWKATKEAYARFIHFQPIVGENAVIQTVAGVEMPILNKSGFANILDTSPLTRENYPRVSILEHDPIPLLWSKH